MIFRLFIPYCAFALIASVSAEEPETPPRPNIILVMSDDQGVGDVGYAGHPVLQTPNLDAGAASGLRLDSFYAAAPSCSPTRASVLTGRHPNRMGVFSWGHSIRPQEITLAEVLKQEGYVTGHFGKWHLGSVRADSPVNPGKNGFDRWVSSENFFDQDAKLSDQGVETKMKGESSAVAADAAIEWISEMSTQESPIFAVIWFGSPHLPHRADPEDSQLYEGESKRMREYLGEVTGVDRAFGRIRETLSELSIKDNTLLWFTSDNGAIKKVNGNAGYRGSKHKLYEGGLRVPAFIEWPNGIPQPTTSDVRCTTSDIFPTVLDLIGRSTSELPPLDGISLTHLFSGEMTSRPTPIGFWNAGIPGKFTNPAGPISKALPTRLHWSEGRIERSTKRAEKLPDSNRFAKRFKGHSAWISGDWKLHRISNGEGERANFELYNLKNDPGEKSELSGNYPEMVKELNSELQVWLESVATSYEGQDY